MPKEVRLEYTLVLLLSACALIFDAYYETVVNNCPVKMSFGNGNDSTIMESIRSMLLSAHVDNVLTVPVGGESV